MRMFFLVEHTLRVRLVSCEERPTSLILVVVQVLHIHKPTSSTPKGTSKRKAELLMS